MSTHEELLEEARRSRDAEIMEARGLKICDLCEEYREEKDVVRTGLYLYCKRCAFKIILIIDILGCDFKTADAILCVIERQLIGGSFPDDVDEGDRARIVRRGFVFFCEIYRQINYTQTSKHGFCPMCEEAPTYKGSTCRSCKTNVRKELVP
jgi:hypothetical protein